MNRNSTNSPNNNTVRYSSGTARATAGVGSANTSKTTARGSSINTGDHNGEAHIRRTPQQPKRMRTSQSLLFAVLIFASILISICVFAILFIDWSDDIHARLQAQSGDPATTHQVGVTDGTIDLYGVRRAVEFTALVHNVNHGTNEITLWHVDTGNTHYVTWTGATDMRDRENRAISSGQFRQGDIVTVRHFEDDNILTFIRHNPSARFHQRVTGLRIVPPTGDALGRIHHGNMSYVFGSELIAVYQGRPFDILTLNPTDIVTIRVYRHVLLFLELNAGSGTLSVPFNSDILGGMITIDGSRQRFENNMTFSLPEGVHRITITGSNIEEYSRNIVITKGQTTTFDTGNVVFSEGAIRFSINTNSNVNLFVNNQLRNINDILQARYGQYQIRVEAQGYQPFSMMITLDQPWLDLDINLTRQQQAATYTTPVLFLTNRPGVSVTVAGVHVGFTSTWPNANGVFELTANIPIGTHQALFSLSGYGNYTRWVTAIQGFTTQVTATLFPN
ncbi:MAG: hypothetical protein FWC95_04570 [Defluviitaleaceae bacterium]|nr:hypothetical protein [Defluviitaleaceae bacterium]